MPVAACCRDPQVPRGSLLKPPPGLRKCSNQLKDPKPQLPKGNAHDQRWKGDRKEVGTGFEGHHLSHPGQLFFPLRLKFIYLYNLPREEGGGDPRGTWVGKGTVGAGGPRAGGACPPGRSVCTAPKSATGAGRDAKVMELPAPTRTLSPTAAVHFLHCRGVLGTENSPHPHERGGVRPRAPG